MFNKGHDKKFSFGTKIFFRGTCELTESVPSIET